MSQATSAVQRLGHLTFVRHEKNGMKAGLNTSCICDCRCKQDITEDQTRLGDKGHIRLRRGYCFKRVKRAQEKRRLINKLAQEPTATAASDVIRFSQIAPGPPSI